MKFYEQLLQRRMFLKTGLGFSSSAFLPGLALAAPRSSSPKKTEPHFFIHLAIEGGMSHSYLFDARPVEFTHGGLATNYLYQNGVHSEGAVSALAGKPPVPYEPRGGGRTWIGPVAESFIKNYGSRVAIVNGVHMRPTSDDHRDNLEFGVTGTAIGERKAVAGKLKGAEGPEVFSFVRNSMGSSFDNDSDGLVMEPNQLKNFAKILSNAPRFSKTRIADRFFLELYARKAGAEFGRGMAKLYAASQSSSALLDSLPKLLQNSGTQGRTDIPSDLVFDGYINMIKVGALIGLAKSFLITIDATGELDVHGSEEAQRVPGEVYKIITRIENILRMLEQTTLPGYPGTLINYTTCLVSFDFNRTMHQMSIGSIYESGTDHNRFGNSLVLFGKGIRGNQVIGETDLDEIQDAETWRRAGSGTLQMAKYRNELLIHSADPISDRDLLLNVGKPFDFQNSRVRRGYNPGRYDTSDYITMPSILNTVMAVFGRSEQEQVSLADPTSGNRAEIIKSLISI